MKRIERTTWLAYIAGYLDGEGSFSAVRGCPRVSVSNCYPWMLSALRQEFGGNVCIKSAAIGNCRTAYQWDAYGDAAVNCCSAVLPYLIEKKPQAELVLEYRSYPPRSAKRAAIEKHLRNLKRTDYV